MNKSTKINPKIMEEYKIITREEVVSLLTQDYYYRKIQQWPLLTSDQFIMETPKIKIENMFGVFNNSGKYFISLGDIISRIEDEHPFTQSLLLKFKHIVACGGAIAAEFTHWNKSNDVDFFFYNVNIDKANKIRLKAIEFLIQCWSSKSNEIKIIRNKLVTSVIIKSGYRKYVYQFIHRIYPNINSILGGFDISACMVAYDGKELYATPLGAWSLKHKYIIADTKRRSTSYEYRLIKYYNRKFSLLFPGLTYDLVVDKLTQDKNIIYNKINDLADLHYLQKDFSLPCLDNRRYDINLKLPSDFILGIQNLSKEHGLNIKFNDNIKLSYECSLTSVQKNANILPYFDLYVDKSLSDKIYFSIDRKDQNKDLCSDYEYTSDPDNDHFIKNNQFDKVCSLLNIKAKDIMKQLLDDVCKPKLNKLNIKTKDIMEKLLDDLEKPNLNIKSDTNTYNCIQQLKGIQWITVNPGRQWTSSINPIIEDPREWYGKHYIPVNVGVPEEIESSLRLFRLERVDSYWKVLPKELFDYILFLLCKQYADDAWNFIL